MALVGKPCPKITGLTFIKGEPVSVPYTAGPTVIEFWATWCGPCRVAFPHLSQLARKYRDRKLLVLGVSLEEDSPQLRAFVAQQGDKMDYTVAIDSAGRAGAALMGAAGVSGIPHAFIVDAKHVIRHHGHPMEPQFAAVLDTVCKEVPPSEEEVVAEVEEVELPAVTASREELLAMPVRKLKEILTERGIGFSDLHEKPELVDRIIERCRNVVHYKRKRREGGAA